MDCWTFASSLPRLKIARRSAAGHPRQQIRLDDVSDGEKDRLAIPTFFLYLRPRDLLICVEKAGGGLVGGRAVSDQNGPTARCRFHVASKCPKRKP